MSKLILRLLKDESGATAIEYGLIVAGISLAIIVMVNGVSNQLHTMLTIVSAQLK